MIPVSRRTGGQASSAGRSVLDEERTAVEDPVIGQLQVGGRHAHDLVEQLQPFPALVASVVPWSCQPSLTAVPEALTISMLLPTVS
jgi:hypothetical protein